MLQRDQFKIEFRAGSQLQNRFNDLDDFFHVRLVIARNNDDSQLLEGFRGDLRSGAPNISRGLLRRLRLLLLLLFVPDELQGAGLAVRVPSCVAG